MSTNAFIKNLINLGTKFLASKLKKNVDKDKFSHLPQFMIEARNKLQNFYKININLVQAINHESTLSLNNIKDLRNIISEHIFSSINYELSTNEVEFINKSLCFNDIIYEYLDLSSYTASIHSVTFSKKSKSKIQKIFPNRIVFREINQTLKNKAKIIEEQLKSTYDPKLDFIKYQGVIDFYFYTSSFSNAPNHMRNKINFFIVNNHISDILEVIDYMNIMYPKLEGINNIINRSTFIECVTNCAATLAEDIAYCLEKMSAHKIEPDPELGNVDYIKQYTTVLNAIYNKFECYDVDLSKTYNVNYYHFMKRIADGNNDSMIEKFKSLNILNNSEGEIYWF